ncbi:peptidase family M48-domain-containing protein [Mycena amicta]|nr:peptidase family M48-domain-containing protein [Mycena amicta]
MFTVLRRAFTRRGPPIQTRLGLAQTRAYSQPKGSIIRPVNQDSALYIGGALGLCVGGYWIMHIESAPETKRRRFMAVSKEEEEQLRKQALDETLKEFEGRILPEDHPITQLVRRITRRIITASNLGHLRGDSPDFGAPVYDPWGSFTTANIPRPSTMFPDKEWVVLVVNDRRLVNAFAAPGLVCVSTGIIPVAENEEGLAAIIGHEIGHVAMRHSAEHLSKAKLFVPIIGFLWLLGIDPWISSTLTKFLYFLPHSRALETEADIVGLKLMSRACYDPAAAPRIFENMQKLESRNVAVPEFLSTHPPTPERIAHLKALLPESYNIYNANPECATLEEMRARRILGRARMSIDGEVL